MGDRIRALYPGDVVEVDGGVQWKVMERPKPPFYRDRLYWAFVACAMTGYGLGLLVGWAFL